MNVIYIAGNMGAGKTTLLNTLKKWYPVVVNEEIDNNPYLKLFFDNPTQYAFHLQVFYLLSRKKRIVAALSNEKTILVDRGMAEDVTVYSRSLYDSGIITFDDYRLVQNLYEEIQIPATNNCVYIYLYASIETLYDRIIQRGYEHDRNITKKYIGLIDNYYREWISQLPQNRVIYVDTEKTDLTQKSNVYCLYKTIEGVLSV